MEFRLPFKIRIKNNLVDKNFSKEQLAFAISLFP